MGTQDMGFQITVIVTFCQPKRKDSQGDYTHFRESNFKIKVLRRHDGGSLHQEEIGIPNLNAP